MNKVAGIGNVAVDVFVNGTDEQLAELNLAKETTYLVSLKEWAEYSKKFPMVFTAPGAPMCSTFSTLALLKMECLLVTAIGDDHSGKTLKAHFEEMGISIENANNSEKERTSRALIIITPDNQRTVLIYLGACEHLSGRHVSMHPMLDCRALILEGYLIGNENARNAIARGAEISHIQNITSVLTLSEANTVKKHRELFHKHIQMGINIVFGNAEQFGVLCGTSSIKETVNACKSRDELSIITQEGGGAVVCQKDTVVEIPATPTKNIIDTTGADAQFLAGFLTAYLKGADIAPAGRFGSVLSSAIIEQISGIFHRDIKDIVARAR